MPVGQPFGTIHEPDGAAYYRVRLGVDIFRLEMPEAIVWLALHRAQPGGTECITRAQFVGLDLSALGVTEPLPCLELLLDLGLVIEFDPNHGEWSRVFAESYRMLTLQTFNGNHPDFPDHYLLEAGTHPTIAIHRPMWQIVAYAPRFGTLKGVCVAQSGVIGAEPETAELGDPATLASYVLGQVGVLLEAHAICFDVAILPEDIDRVYGAWMERPREVAMTEDDTTPYGLCAIGYPLGQQFMWLGLEDVRVRVGLQALSLRNAKATAVWSTAHGVVIGQTVDDSEKAICAAVRQAGVFAPIHHLDDQTERGLIAQPEGDRELVEFAVNHRLEALLAGIGNTRRDPDTYILGVDRETLICSLPARAFHVWQNAPLSGTLLDAAYSDGRAGTAEELRGYLRDVQLVCARRAGYIDTVHRI